MESVTSAMLAAPASCEHRGHDGRVQVRAVGDQFKHRNAGCRAAQAGGNRSRRPVVQGRHAVEEVGHRGPRAAPDGDRPAVPPRPSAAPPRQWRRRSPYGRARGPRRARPAAGPGRRRRAARGRSSSWRGCRVRRPPARRGVPDRDRAGSQRPAHRTWPRRGRGPPGGFRPAGLPRSVRASRAIPRSSDSAGGGDEAGEQGGGSGTVQEVDGAPRRGLPAAGEVAAVRAVAVQVHQAGKDQGAGRQLPAPEPSPNPAGPGLKPGAGPA